MSDNTASAKANQSKSDKPKDPSFNMDELRELAELVNEHGFTDFEFENENIRVRLSKTTPAAAVQAAPVAALSVAPPVQTAAPVVEAEEPTADSDAGLFKITSPIVGTFYGAPGPDKEPYVKEGSKVTPESVVCIVEAMKLMNEIQAETSGEVVKIYVENGQPVEYGQPLFGIKQ
ncbi:MAG TPA: acetyl-CoA carboxylase biotin carboxyl carrier protein [Pyrinomonadaceae bacterium]|jgi:acetyl-CoA carboxylase biotin carboxyl carrier protein|nr:acetyl-CoA carboxylase biotin carboxyl carrier protein [Pyrinomonadaceae bacterium]